MLTRGGERSGQRRAMIQPTEMLSSTALGVLPFRRSRYRFAAGGPRSAVVVQNDPTLTKVSRSPKLQPRESPCPPIISGIHVLLLVALANRKDDQPFN